MHFNFAYHTNKAPDKNTDDRRASGECGTSGSQMQRCHKETSPGTLV